MNAERLRALRAELGYSQRRLGELLGYRDPATTISRMERGIQRIPDRTAAQLEAMVAGPKRS